MMLELVLTFFFGSPRAILAARIFGAMASLCPCAPADAACEARHARATTAIVVVASADRDPEDAAGMLLGLAAHETCFRVEHQANGGPAVTWWQIEVSRRQRPALLADPVLAARTALRIARSSRDLSTYAGRPIGHGGRAAAELRHYVQIARWALAAR